MNTGLLIIRLALGGALMLQGASKLTRSGRAGTAAYFSAVHLAPAAPLALLAGITEVGAGALLGAGAATPLAAAALVGVLVNATVVKWENGYWDSAGGAEYPLLALLAAAGLAFTGPGAFSVDALAGWHDITPAVGAAAVAGGVLAAAPLLARRARSIRRSKAAGTTPASQPERRAA